MRASSSSPVLLLAFLGVVVVLACTTSAVSAVGTSAAAGGQLEVGADMEWIEPSFVESLSEATNPVPYTSVAAKKPAPAPARPGSFRPAPAPVVRATVASVGAPAPVVTPNPTPAVSVGGRYPAHPGGPLASTPVNLVIPADLLALGSQYTRPARVGPVSNACPKSAPLMADAVLTQLLTGLWTAFGATPAQAQRYAASNLKQIHRESTGCPNVIQSASTKDVNSKSDPAGGLVQFTQSTFGIWHVRGTVIDRLNPVSNLAAAINAQVHGWRMTACHTGRVLNGCSGWSPDSNKAHNPYAGV